MLVGVTAQPKLKHFRAVATRYDERDDNYLAAVKLASIRWPRLGAGMPLYGYFGRGCSVHICLNFACTCAGGCDEPLDHAIIRLLFRQSETQAA